MSGLSYCVICTRHDNGRIRVVGPFSTQAATVDWAAEVRIKNDAWEYTPDVIEPPKDWD